MKLDLDDSSGHPSRFELTRFHAGEIEANEHERLSNHLSGCVHCRAFVHELDQFRQDFHASHDREKILERVRAGTRKASWFGNLLRPRILAPLVAAGALALLIIVWLPRIEQPGERMKGAEIELGYWIMQAGQPRLAEQGQILHPGDRIQFWLTAPAGGYVHIVGIDEAGQINMYFPRPKEKPDIFPGGAGRPVPGSIILDKTLGQERVFVLICKQPLSADSLVTKASKLPGGVKTLITAERMPLDCSQAGILLHKETR